jgi:hypothetical protein
MKKLFFILFLIFPLVLFSQEDGSRRLPLVFSLSGDELKTLITSKASRVKMSDEEIIKISKIIDGEKSEYFKLVDKVKKSIPFGANGRPIGKADSEVNRQLRTLSNEVCTSIYNILGDKRYRQFNRTLIDESERQNNERLRNAMKNRKK